MQQLSRLLYHTTVFLLLFTLIFTPLVWTPETSELFEFPKMVFIYFMTTLIFTTWITRMVIEKRWLLSRTKFDLPILAFLASQILSTIFSIHPRTSFLGYYSRFHGGLLSSLCYIGLYYAFVSHFTSKTLKYLILALITSAALASLYALPEHFGYAISCLSVHNSLQATCWIQDIVNRIFGTFGQPNWLAAYLIAIFPLTWTLLFIPKSHRHSHLIFYLSLLLQLLFATILIFTRSKSGFLGLAVATLIFWTLTLAKHHSPAIKPSLVGIGIPLLVYLAIHLSTLPLFSRLTNFSSNLSATSSTTPQTTGPALESGDISFPIPSLGSGTPSSKIRQIVWTGALNLFTRHPLLGTGLETFGYAYYQTRPLAHNLVSEWDFIYNKAHNEFLNLAANSGALGLITYTTLILYFLYLTISSTLSPSQSNLAPPFTNLALASGFIALTISNFFGFSTVPVGVIFFLFPAIYHITTRPTTSLFPLAPKSSTSHPPHQTLSPYQIATLFFLSVFSLAAIYHIGRYLYADITYAKAKTTEALGQLTPALTNYQTAVSLFPNEPTYTNDLADIYSKAAQLYATQENQPLATRFANLATKYSTLTLSLNPYHLNFYKTQAGVFIRLSAVNPQYLEQARFILEQAQTLAPTDAKITYNLGLIYLDLDQPDQAFQIFQQVVNAKSNYEAARLQLAQMYQDRDQNQQAIEQYQYILNYISPQNPQAQQALESLQPSN